MASPFSSAAQPLDYLMVVQAPLVSHGLLGFAVDSAFAAHLRELRTQLGERVLRLVIAAPSLPAEAAQPSWEMISPSEGIVFVPTHPASLSRPRFLLTRLVPVWRQLSQLVRQACIVHSGMSTQLAQPIMFMACLIGRMAGKPVVFYVDIDNRRTSERFHRLGAWGWRSYLLNRWVYDPLKWIQLWLAPRLFDLVLYKSQNLVETFGAGRPHVHNFFDTVHRPSDVISDAALAARLQQRRTEPEPKLRLVIFGRWVPYKGIERAIEAVKLARQRGAAVELSLIGDGASGPALREMAQDPVLKGAIHFFPPRAYGPELFEALDAADLMLATPLIEDTPRAAFDAMARGLPIAAFDIAYFKDLAQGSGAVTLVPWPSSQALAERLVELAADRRHLEPMAWSALTFARENVQEIWVARRLAWTFELLQQR